MMYLSHPIKYYFIKNSPTGSNTPKGIGPKANNPGAAGCSKGISAGAGRSSGTSGGTNGILIREIYEH
jgi:hypothetical protein